MISYIDEILTPGVKHECRGLAILVVTIDEYEAIISSLKRTKKDSNYLQLILMWDYD